MAVKREWSEYIAERLQILNEMIVCDYDQIPYLERKLQDLAIEQINQIEDKDARNKALALYDAPR